MRLKLEEVVGTAVIIGRVDVDSEQQAWEGLQDKVRLGDT